MQAYSERRCEVTIILNLHKSNDSTILNDNLSIFGASRDFFNSKRSEN